MTDNTSGGVLAALSNELASAVQRVSQSVVSVEARRQGPASGIVWPSPQGTVIVTADHVVERDEDIGITLANGQKVGATIAGRDPGSDVAVLRLANSQGAPASAELAPADSIQVGHLVLAVGRPGAAPMASFGIVSATGGSWRTARGGIVEGYIRADVALYPGFSGGPLVDARGRVAGLNSWHLAQGQEIAIPAQTVSGIVQTLLTHGKVRRGYLGVTSQAVAIPANLQQKLGSSQNTGLVVVGVEPGSPAEKGGLVIGDVLVTLAGRAVTDAEELQIALAGNVVGQATPAVVLRGGERKELSLTPGERS